MSDATIVNLSRRRFLKATAGVGAGLTLGLYLPGLRSGRGVRAAESPAPFAPNAFVRIGTDDRVTVIAKHLEMGQGTYTGLATLVAEELDAAWEQVHVEGAPADVKRYNNLLWGEMQGTGGSTAIANSFTQMRKAGATAREMLVRAAAREWGVEPGAVTVEKGWVRHDSSGRKTGFGALAELAAAEEVPEDVFLKDPEDFTLIGKGVPRKDSPEKINGSAVFTQDVKLDGMLTAVVAHPPRFGAKVASFDAAPARRIRGVVDVVRIPTGVAVVAKDFWSASQGRDRLKVEWDESEAFKLGSGEIMDEYRELAGKPGAAARNDGDAAKALEGAAKVVEADYEFPYLAHAAMEPMNCVVRLREGGCEIWNGEQFQTPDQRAVAELLGIEPERVKLHMLYAGGSFGRRANPHSDYVLEAVNIARAIDGKAPVKLVWTREDDMRAGWYRPMYFHRVRAGLDGDGRPVAWHHRIVGQSIMAGTPMAGMIQDGVDPTSVEGVQNLPYTIPNIHVDLHSPEMGVPVQWWRSVGSTHTAFAVETFVDQLAAAAGKDPVAFRRDLLGDHPRWLGVLELAADKGGWGEPLPEGRGRGIAVHEAFNTFVAQVAEVSVKPGGRFTVDRVVVAVDCGIPVNPDVIHAQMEGGVGFGLAAALVSRITLDKGRVEQGNFDDYEVLRIGQMPEVEVHIVPSTAQPTGVGEPAVPVIAPAVANALTAATGKRFHALPLSLG
ncbi:MAG: xanthine dehydrogenase family protein molybdopterin-binding subunit [Chromatiales bacterium]|jgi:isoquinoline 1-oxidoreductase beta subunit